MKTFSIAAGGAHAARGKYFAAVALVAFTLLLSACSLPVNTETDGTAKGPTVVLETAKGPADITVDIADTSDERTRGLMFRKSLPQDSGMFFIFDGEDQRSFWMKNTLIPLDMIFMDAGYKVVSVAKNVQPCKKDPCQTYPSVKPAKFVLEVNGGMSDSIGLKEGDKAQLTL
jgi:uncharacterized protein